ncbi:MAG: hypothetical protein QGH51_06480 [Planctomycetota bacterium]|jgi:hypothetical protein|nr:hypothetical protein [Planctomycetota bacterium]MDP6941659.1 hypothetical protein [Planctomycetota bacterium]
MPAFFAALCFVVSFMLLATLLDEITEEPPTAQYEEPASQRDASLLESTFPTAFAQES